jgi:hypothetical protein
MYKKAEASFWTAEEIDLAQGSLPPLAQEKTRVAVFFFFFFFLAQFFEPSL